MKEIVVITHHWFWHFITWPFKFKSTQNGMPDFFPPYTRKLSDENSPQEEMAQQVVHGFKMAPVCIIPSLREDAHMKHVWARPSSLSSASPTPPLSGKVGSWLAAFLKVLFLKINQHFATFHRSCEWHCIVIKRHTGFSKRKKPSSLHD